MDKISVVIPLHNKAGHIRRALHSVLSQTMHEFEVIVVNDASTDGGEKAVQAMGDGRIRLLRRDKPGAGGHAARNLGIGAARSGLIAFLDADDMYNPEFLRTVLRLHGRYPEAGAFATAYVIQAGAGSRVLPRYAAIPPHPWEGLIPDYFRSVLDAAPPVWTSATCVRKEVFNEAGFFPEGEKKGGDQDMWLRIALRYPIAYSTYRGAVYFRDAQNRIGNTVSLCGYKLVRTAQDALKDPRFPPQDAAHLREYIARYQLEHAAHLVCALRQEEARRALEECATSRFYGRKLGWSLWARLPAPALRLALAVKRYLRGLRARPGGEVTP
ncbi:MAG: glycosyltransferase family 2 protein [Endomicrobiales bacterium]